MKKSIDLRNEIMDINDEISKTSAIIERQATNAKDEAIEVEARQEIINQIELDKAQLTKLEERKVQLVEEEKTLRAKEEEETSMTKRLSQEGIEENKPTERSDIYSSVEYRDAWCNSIRKNDNTIVERFLTTTVDQSAGILVPTQLLNKIQERVREGGKILNLCRITTFKGLTETPIIGNKSKPAWHNEGDGATPNEKTKKTVDFSKVSIEPEYLAEILQTTKKFEALTIEAFFAWLMEELPDALLSVIDAAILTAPQTGTYGIRGITTNTDTNFVKVLANHVLNFNTANSAVSKLGSGVGSRAKIVMNSSTFYDNIMGFVDTTGRPIYTIMTDNLGSPSMRFGGYEVVFSDELPSYDDATTDEAYIVMGDFKAMNINFPLGLSPEMTRDAVTNKHLNLIDYLSEILVGGNIDTLDSLVKVTK